MRRAPLILVLLAACAAPRIALFPSFAVGSSRTYRVHTDATTVIDTGSTRTTSRTQLSATAKIEVVSVKDGKTTIRLTLEPQRYTKNGSPRTLDTSTAELIVDEVGAIVAVSKVGGLPADTSATSVEDLAPIFGAPLPEGVVHVGQAWTRALGSATNSAGSGVQHGRVEALRRVGGYDCAILQLGTERPLSRRVSLEEQSIDLSGEEFSTAHMAFAYKRGFPVQIVTDAEAHFSIQTVASAGVTITSHTSLDLVNS
ncbi:MAG: hypothetical protein ABR552_07375 [Actinomycetota bacterium]